MLNENREYMHGSEIDTSSEAAACLPWDEFGSEVWSAISLAFAMFETRLFFPEVEGGIGYQARVWRRLSHILHPRI